MSDYITVNQAIENYPIGRSKLYELISSGDIKSFSLGRRRVVVASSIDAYLAALADTAA